MAPAGPPDHGVNAFLVEDRVLFSHYFDESEVFAALKPYYDNQQYRFGVPIAVFPNVLRVLVRHGYDVTYHRDASDFVVAVKQYSQHPEDIFKQSVAHRSVGDWNCFLLRSRAAVERAVRTHARPIANAPVRDPFDYVVRTDGIGRRADRGIRALSLAASRSTLEARFDVDVPEDYASSYNLAPGDRLATVTDERPGTLAWFHWGLVPFWADEPDEPGDPAPPLTAPAGTVDEAPMVAEAFEHRRCLVLVDGFYVWQPAHGAAANGEPGGIEPADDEATGGESADDEPPDDDAADAETIRPYRVTTRDEEPFAVAGVWEVWAARGSSHLSVGLVTTDADAAVRDVTDEMPVVLDEPGRERWLDAADADEVRDLLAGGSTPDLGIAPVSRAVTDPTNDGPDVARTVDVSRQVGLDAFAGPEK